MAIPSGFFAYPSAPAAIPESIKAAVDELNLSEMVRLTTWEEMRIAGKIVIAEICDSINRHDLFVADLTTLNPNVMFELGYAIAKNKRVWLLLDVTRAKAKANFEQLKLLSTVGYRRYCNSKDIVNAFYTDLPCNDVHATLFSQLIEPNIEPASNDMIFHLKSSIENEAEIRITKRLSDSIARFIVDDPKETAGQPFSWYAKQVYSAVAILCHLTHPSRADSPVHTARQSLIAGMAYGLNRRLLILAEEEFLTPLDYRDISKNYTTATEAIKLLNPWLESIESEVKHTTSSRQSISAKYNLATELKGLDLGEPMAENEDHRLVEDFFIDTSVYHAALRGQQRIFVGRKGSGKTANLKKLEETFSKSRKNLVCTINPASYEIQGIARLLGEFCKQDQKGYAIESLWKYLLYSEIANTAATQMSERSIASLEVEELELQQFVATNPEIQEEFSVRLENCIRKLTDIQSVGNHQSIADSRKTISEALHEGLLRQLREKLLTGLLGTERIVILIDNLDKAWDHNSDVTSLAEVLLGLLTVVSQIGKDFHRKGERDLAFTFNVALFLRADIFHNVTRAAREPDKLLYIPVVWSDTEQLVQVIEERYKVCRGGNIDGSEIWSRFFCPVVANKSTRDYILSRIFRRPRDLLVFVTAAISKAVAKKHEIIQEKDILDAEKEYSDFAVTSLCVEDDTSTVPLLEVIIEFAGSPAILSQNQIAECLGRAKITPESIVTYTDYLCSLGFLGIEVAQNEFRFVEDPSELRKISTLGARWTEKNGIRRYKINTPFWAYLEVAPEN